MITNRVCNLKKRGGGVVILVNKCIKTVQVEHLTHQIADEIDMLSIKIILPNINNIIICAVYRRPSYNKQLLYDILYNSFNSYNFSNNNIILYGDFNINYMDSLDSQPFFNILHQLDLFYVIHTPTRFSTSTASLIDNFCIDKNLINMIVQALFATILRITYHYI